MQSGKERNHLKTKETKSAWGGARRVTGNTRDRKSSVFRSDILGDGGGRGGRRRSISNRNQPLENKRGGKEGLFPLP